MVGRFLIAAILLCFNGAGSAVLADDKLVRLAVPKPVVQSGLMKYMLPRFTLKTQIRIELVAPGAPADAAIGTGGTPIFAGAGETWSLDILSPDHKGAARFETWITDATGQSAITGFTVDGTQPFSLPVEEEEVEDVSDYAGDDVRGKRVSRVHCGRCHVTAKGDEGLGIGSTPSFSALRGFDDWDARFAGFFVLKPHAAFTQIAGVTGPFPIDRPSPIAPMELTVDDIDAILAYVAGLEPAGLGGPIQHQ